MKRVREREREREIKRERERVVGERDIALERVQCTFFK